jgi:aminoglycoside phosphotransferase (APT) family kinase protein
MLTARESVAYLLRRGLLSESQLVGCDLVLVDASRRNRNFKIVSHTGPSYVIKQAASADGMLTLRREAAAYRLFTSRDEARQFAPYLPKFFGHDEEHHLLVLELVPDARDVREEQTQRGRFSTGLATAMGNALACLHRIPPDLMANGDGLGSLEDVLPWALSLHRPTVSLFRETSSANIQLIKIVQKFAIFCDLIDRIRNDWRPTTPVHADLKWDNWIVSRARRGRAPMVHLVDWELAGIGDPCWDVGSAFHDYLSCWLFSIPITGATPPERFPELARHPLAQMQPAIRAFWQSYRQAALRDAQEAYEFLLRSVKYAAVRLIQTSMEQMQPSVQLTGNVVCVMQVAFNILQRPHDAIVHLLGLPIAGLETMWSTTGARSPTF